MSLMAAVKIEKIAYKGWPNCYRITNGTVELVMTGDVGPRVMRLGFVGGQNMFKEYEDQLGKSGEKEYQLRGGHRLWVAPETLATSWALDNTAVKIEAKGDTLIATSPVDPQTRIVKQIAVKLSPEGATVEVVHRIRNDNPWTIEFAPWALTMMAPGGTAISGFPPRGKHPEVLAATNPLVMWAYTDLSDPRWTYTAKYIALRQDAKAPAPQKIGMFNPNTWAAYLLGSDLFVKRVKADPSKTYPDFGCSFETFTNNEMLEIETLGPLQQVEPGATVEHVEHWSLYKDVHIANWSDADLDAVIAPKLK